MTTSRWITILATVLVSGGVAWLVKLVAIAILVVTGAPDIESAAVAFFYLTGLGLLFIGSTALGLRLTMGRQAPLRIAAMILPHRVFGFVPDNGRYRGQYRRRPGPRLG